MPKDILYSLKIAKNAHKLNERKAIKNIDKIITNSKNIQTKLKKKYNRISFINYPPIKTSEYNYKKNKGYWLSINRIVPLKRIELQIKAFSKLPNEKLYIIGDKENKIYYEKLEKIKPKNVVFLDVVKEKELIKKLSEAKGLIFTAMDEDFGMAPVEAMASGKPVIAPNEGGCKETIIQGKTGILIDNINEDKLAEAIKILGKNPEKYKNACLKQAKRFDTKIFIKNMLKHIEK